jgi:SOS response regulatory protein OraA/RecX
MAPRLRRPDDSPTDRGAARVPTPDRLQREALRLLARREVTASQIRAHLERLGGRREDIERIVAALQADGSLDDRRAARLHAQTAFRVRRRARLRILAELEARGVAGTLAREVVDEICSPEVERRRLDEALGRRLRGTRREARDPRRLFAALVREGYDPDQVRLALERAGLGAESDEPR